MRIFSIAAFFFILLAVGPVRAQDSLPSVEIDTSVLEELGTRSPDTHSEAPHLVPPVQALSRPTQPNLTKEGLSAPPQQAAAPVARAPEKAPPDLEFYPVKTVVKSETLDPGFDKTPEYEIMPQPEKTARAERKVRPEAVPSKEKPAEKDAVLTPMPAPQAAPSKKIKTIEKARTIAVAAVAPEKKQAAPLPGHKPVAAIEKRAQWIAALDKPKQAAKRIEAGAVRMTGKPSMPAVPAGTVISEKLPGSVSDPLAKLLVLPDREKLVKMVEDIAGRTLGVHKAAAAVPVPPKPPKLVRTQATPMSKEDATRVADITALASIEPSAGKQEYAGDLTENFDQVIEKKKIVEKATSEPVAQQAKTEDAKEITFKPRPPPELAFDSEYISLPFPEGISLIDDEIQSALQGRILPALKDNPGLRVQIQAFAAPRDSKPASARRLSLARALSVREWLLGQGIDAARMDVRALGMETDRNPADRVDMVFVDPARI